jgi:hypothetical protein
MATIQNIPGNEAPATSRAKINSNFTAVNDEVVAKVNAASPTFTGPVTTSGAVINAGTAMTGEQINVALRNNL